MATVGGFKLVIRMKEVWSRRGADVTLGCHLSPATSAVAMEIRWFRGTDCIYLYKDGHVTVRGEYKDRWGSVRNYEGRVSVVPQQLQTGDVSLILKGSRQEDEGVYTCQVISGGHTQERSVRLYEWVAGRWGSGSDREITNDERKRMVESVLSLGELGQFQALSKGEWRIVLLGNNGAGKSSTGNTILEEDFFEVGISYAVTNMCEAHSGIVNGRKITVIDTPGFLNDKEELHSEIERCLTLSSPGPHAFIFVINADERFTTEDSDLIRRIEKLFTSDVFKHTVIVYTHGKYLKDRKQSIADFIGERRGKGTTVTLKDLVDKCGGRHHVIDNQDWQKEQEGEYSNRRQIEKLFDTIEKMVQRNGGYYTK